MTITIRNIEANSFVMHNLFKLFVEPTCYNQNRNVELLWNFQKKGDKTESNNWFEITILPTINKVFNIVLLDTVNQRKTTTRLKDYWEMNKHNLNQKDQVFVFRNIIEQSLRRKSSLYLIFFTLRRPLAVYIPFIGNGNSQDYTAYHWWLLT